MRSALFTVAAVAVLAAIWIVLLRPQPDAPTQVGPVQTQVGPVQTPVGPVQIPVGQSQTPVAEGERPAAEAFKAPSAPLSSETFDAPVPRDLELAALLESPARAVVRTGGRALTLAVDEQAPWGKLLGIDLALGEAQFSTDGGRFTLRLPPAAEGTEAEPVVLDSLVYEGLHVRVDAAILEDEMGFGFAPLPEGLLVESEALGYAGLQPGDIVRGINLISVEEMRRIGELGSILAGGRLQLDVLRDGQPHSVVVELQY